MALLNLPAYASSVWNTVLATLTYAQNNLDSSDIQGSALTALACAQTFRNARESFDASGVAQGLAQAYAALAPVLTFTLTLDTATQAFITNRIGTLQSSAQAALLLVKTPVLPSLAIPQGMPAVADPLLLEFMMGFSYETPPTLTTGTDIAVQAQAAAQAWATLQFALQTQGVPVTGGTLTAVAQMYSVASLTAAAVANITISPFATLTEVWNTIVAGPTCFRMADVYFSDPTSLAGQQFSIARLATCQALDQFNALCVNLRDLPPTQVRLVTIRKDDTLPQIAARELGDFEVWYSIAQINALQPPYITPLPTPTTASPGQQIYLPTGSGAITVAQKAPSYTVNYLGVDLYYGPLNQEMSAWTGDFQTISGYANLSISLGRRLQTTLGTLMFHSDFGSRIPPEVGSIATSPIVDYLSAYAQSAILSDPRVATVNSIRATVGANYSVQIVASVSPNGFGPTSLTLNEVLQP